jgi:hypothetical protein
LLTPQPILPARLDDLLNLLRDGLVYPVPVLGATTSCTGYETHDMRLWVTGSLNGRSMRLLKCADCESVEVRDVSLDLNVGGSRLARRPLNRLLGWYTGRRPANRTFSGRR